MRRGYERRLDKSFRNAPVVPFSPHSRLVLFSDCHRGVGNSNDNFLKNQHLYFAALKHYYAQGYTYIELGDGDELWENRNIHAIREIHSNVFWLLSCFQKRGRLYMIYGNHDYELRESRDFPYHAGIILKGCGFFDPASPASCPYLEFYLTHGNQVDLLNSTLWKLSRFLVRYVWKPLEQIGILDPTSAARNYRIKEKSEKRLNHWAEKNQRCLITGHTHRPVLGSLETHYFNTGSCVHPRCITCIEIADRSVLLVKWSMESRNSVLYVGRTVLEELKL